MNERGSRFTGGERNNPIFCLIRFPAVEGIDSIQAVHIDRQGVPIHNFHEANPHIIGLSRPANDEDFCKNHCRQVIYGLLPLRQADRTLDVLRLSGRTFSSFLSGQCLEACILGTLFVAAMTIFRMPYALLVGVLIALTALIPIVGAFIGCAVGALLIAIDDPWKALWFIVLFLVLQQIEGNLIYPHVVGSSVGLPSIWVLAAVTLGGKLMGITGMLFFIPLCSVIYALFRSYVKNRLVSKAVPPEKWRDPPPPPSRQ